MQQQQVEYAAFVNRATETVAQMINSTTVLREEAERICSAADLDQGIAADNLREWVEGLIRDNAEGLERALASMAASVCNWRIVARDLCEELIDAAASEGVDRQMAMWDAAGLYREV